MDVLKTMRLGMTALSVAQTQNWLEGRPLPFVDAVEVQIETFENGHRMVEGVVVSLDDLVEFVKKVRDEWRAGRDVGQSRRVTT